MTKHLPGSLPLSAAVVSLVCAGPLAAGPDSRPAGPRAADAAKPARVELPRSSPEAQGIASSAILAFLKEAEEKVDALHSFMLLRHGTVVAEGWWAPYLRNDPHVLFSLSKSFTSTAVGLAVAEGRLSLDDRVVDAFPEDAPADPGPNLRAMRIRDLLSMSTGHHAEAIDDFPFGSDKPLPKLFLALPVAHKPGTHFVYNTPASYMLSAMVQKATGSSVLEYLRPRLFEPLGIESPTWDADRQGVSLGGFGLSLRTEDIARFGQLYLQKGAWQGRQVLPAAWVTAATSRQVSNGSSPESDWEQGYAYQFWRARHGLYRGDGAFGQFCIVMPDEDAVVAITSGTPDMAEVMDLVWEHLLPAMNPGALPADARAASALRQKLASLVLRPQAGAASSPTAARVSGTRYAIPANRDKLEAVTLETGGEAVTLVTKRAGRESRVPLGYSRWGTPVMMPASVGGMPPGEQKASGSGAWTSDDTYTAKVCLQQSPFVLTLVLHFVGDTVEVDQEWNVGFGETKRPRLTGRR